MEDQLLEILGRLGYPVRRQGSLSPDQKYPETFITFWNSIEDELSPYDNETALSEHDYAVYVYSTDPQLTYDVLAEAREILKVAGWIIMTRGYDVSSDEPTHTGRGMDIAYIETMRRNNHG